MRNYGKNWRMTRRVKNVGIKVSYLTANPRQPAGEDLRFNSCFYELHVQEFSSQFKDSETLGILFGSGTIQVGSMAIPNNYFEISLNL